MDTIYFLGRFHVLALHLPIGIIIAAVTAEWFARRTRSRSLTDALPFLWGMAACTAVLTMVLGYMHFAEGGFVGPSASAHRLLGSAVAAVAVLVWLLCMRWREVYAKVGLATGILLLVLVTLTGHYGGNLTHGSSYLVEYAPQPIRTLLGVSPRRATITSVAAADPYYDIVQPMLEQHCSTCHNADKRESGFSVASYESTLAGGESGAAVVPGQVEQSELLRRVSLMPDDEAFMPAEGRTPLNSSQLEVLRWWIDAGAPRATTMAAAGAGASMELLVRDALVLEEDVVVAQVPAAGAAADASIIEKLYQAGFLVRQVSQSDPHFIVSVYSPGAPLRGEQLATLATAAAHIVELDLQDAGVGDDALAVIEEFSQLERLRVSNGKLTDAGLQHLAGLGRLSVLNLYGNAGITDASVDTLAAMKTLKRLYVWGTGVSTGGAARLNTRRPDIAIDMGAEPFSSAATAAPPKPD